MPPYRLPSSVWPVIDKKYRYSEWLFMDLYSSLCPPLSLLFLPFAPQHLIPYPALPPPPTFPAAQVRVPPRQWCILRQLRDHGCSARHRHGADALGVTLHVLYPPLLFQIRARESSHQKGEGQLFSEQHPQLLLGGKRRGLARSPGTHDERPMTMGSYFLDSNKGRNVVPRNELPASSLEESQKHPRQGSWATSG